MFPEVLLIKRRGKKGGQEGGREKGVREKEMEGGREMRERERREGAVIRGR